MNNAHEAACDAIEEQLSDLIDDELPVAARARVEQHIASCERCRIAYRQLQRTVRFVRANANVDMRAGTPGRWYEEFTRALSDPAFSRDATTVMRDRGYLDGEGRPKS
jgi:anti-sigma factor RsiW